MGSAKPDPVPGLQQLQMELNPMSPLITAQQMLEKSYLSGKGCHWVLGLQKL